MATKAAEPKVSQSKVQQPAKPPPTKKPAAAAARLPLSNRPPLGRTPPASPASKPLGAAKPSTPGAKRGTKPTQTVSPFTKKSANLPQAAARPQSTAASVTAAEPVQVTETEAAVDLEPPAVSSTVEELPTHVSTQHEGAVQPEVTLHGEAVPLLSQSPVKTSPPTSPHQEQSENCAVSSSMQEQVCSPAKPSSPTVASSADLPQETEYLSTDQTPSAPAAHSSEANTVPQTAPPPDGNEEEDDEEEKEGSQLVSMSEMSGTTQPTEESRPGSGGPVGGAAWKAGGALLSELDSEDVSGSQQGASELSAPGVLEGTESTDDLGDGSLKGAMDMEGASAGSPDFEKVPDIPVNEFEDEDEDDSDRVCDMEVGSERTDEPRRPRHDNDVYEDEDDDVEMASEGVTESGLESYGNADEDDFAEDERLDNLNRVLQPPPPPPVLPSAPAAQWDQQNPFASPWAEPPQSHIPQLPEEAAARASSDPLAPDSETSVQTPAQAWLQSAPSAIEQDVPHHPSVPDSPHNVGTQGPAPVSPTGMSVSNAVSSEMGTPAKQADVNQEATLQSDSSLPDAEALIEEEEEEAEPETLPADEVFGGPSAAPTSNPSSSSVTEDEASDTEGEAQLEDSLACPTVANLTFEHQPPPQRCLSTVEEGEEAESGAGSEVTPLSATSVASYIFDSVTTASNSNAQSTGESCIKSPGIFSLEELSEEAKEPGVNREQQCPAEQPYIECGKQEAEAATHIESERPESNLDKPEEMIEDIQPTYYSICEKTEDSFAGNV